MSDGSGGTGGRRGHTKAPMVSGRSHRTPEDDLITGGGEGSSLRESSRVGNRWSTQECHRKDSWTSGRCRDIGEDVRSVIVHGVDVHGYYVEEGKGGD